MNHSDFLQLHKASRAGDVKFIAQFVSKINPKLPAEKKWLDRALPHVVYGRSVEATRLLLSAGANPNQDTISGPLVCTPASNGDLPLLKCLIEGGADYNREYKRQTALSTALEAQSEQAIDYLEKLGAQGPPDTMLFYACRNGDLQRARQARAKGAGIEKTFDGETPLMVAVSRVHVEIAKFLLEQGANPNKQVKDTTALLSVVRYSKSLEVFELLVAAGADIHAKYFDQTLLMAAARAGSLPFVKRLVELGNDVNARDKNFNQTALDHAKAGKHKAVVDYLLGLGAISDRETELALVKRLAKEYGGKPIESSHGFLLNSKFFGNQSQFQIEKDLAAVVAFKLNFKDAELKRAEIPGLIFGEDPPCPTPYATPGTKKEVAAASKLLGITVRRSAGKNAVSESFIMAFCRRHKNFLDRLNLSTHEQVGITADGVRFYWADRNIDRVVARLEMLRKFLSEIASLPQPERHWLEKEWLIKPAPRAMPAKSAHILGGTAKPKLACPTCGAPSNLMAQIDFSDALLPKTFLGARRLPVFWCLTCLEWDPAFFDISRPAPKPLRADGKKPAVATESESGEEDLEECRVELVPVPAGKKAGLKSKLGGAPGWIQSEDTPDCPKCQKPMAFALQLASDSRISYCDMGMLYAFVCPECKITASLIQSH